MKTVLVYVNYTGNNFTALVHGLDGCYTTGNTIPELKKNVTEVVLFHLEGMIECDMDIPEEFKEEYEFTFNFSAEALLNYYSGIFTKAALSRITGINERQLWHYAAGVSKPRAAQLKKIQDGLHNLGGELSNIQLI